MGIGNTTSSAAITAVMTGRPVEEVTGHGTGIQESDRAHKVRVIQRALDLHRPKSYDPIGVLAKSGGLEIAGLAGLMLGAAASRVPVVLDGFIAGAAALIAVGIQPLCREYLIAAHRSVETRFPTTLVRPAIPTIIRASLSSTTLRPIAPLATLPTVFNSPILHWNSMPAPPFRSPERTLQRLVLPAI